MTIESFHSLLSDVRKSSPEDILAYLLCGTRLHGSHVLLNFRCWSDNLHKILV